MESFWMSRATNIAIDLGNSNTILTNKLRIPLSQPSYVVFNNLNKTVKAVGNEAYEMSGKTNQSLKVIKPLKGGVVKDFDSASQMLRTLVKLAHPEKSFFSRFNMMVCGVPFFTTEVERRALRDLLSNFNSLKSFLLFEPIAAAIGMGLNIREAEGKFIVDIGGGITEAVAISLSGVVNGNSIRIAGDSFDYEIQEYVRKKYNVTLSLNNAEKVKINVGSAYNFSDDDDHSYVIIGKDNIEGIPKEVKLYRKEFPEVLEGSISKIEEIILQTLEECPPEISADICQTGVYLTGGGSMLHGLKERLELKLNLPVHIDPNPLMSVAVGIQTVLNNPDLYKPILLK